MKPRKYIISPARGQALLNFQGRLMPSDELSMSLYEADLTEEVRQKHKKGNGVLPLAGVTEKQKELNPDFRNLLMHGDCLSACAYLKAKNIRPDLVYIDPPFASGANYAKKL